MNPDTKLTVEQLKLICRQHKIPYHSHSRITIGFSHEVHRLNDDLIIKLFNGQDEQRFRTERALLKMDAAFRKPRLVASSARDTLVGRDYVIMTYVPGVNLGSHWHRASGAQRENLIREISYSLRAINKLKPEAIGLVLGESWQQTVADRSDKLVAKLRDDHIINDATANRVSGTIREGLPTLAGTAVVPDYCDIHFDNFIVSERFELLALIDLENVQLASLDYPLGVVRKQMDEPENYLRKEDEKFADRNDYAMLWEWYQRYYPEMFDFRDLGTRVKLYQLLDTLQLLVDWAHVKSLHRKLDELTVTG